MSVPLQMVDDPRVTPHRIMPVRLTRAVTDIFADPNAPDLDERGYLTDAFCSARGPVVGVIQGRTIRVRLVREALDRAARLFVTTEDAAIVRVDHPAAGAALNSEEVAATATDPVRPADNLFLTGTAAGAAEQMTLVKVRYGAMDGPVLVELAVRVYPVINIPVQAHFISIGHTAATVVDPMIDMAGVRALFEQVNRIYAQAGIVFQPTADAMPDTLPRFARDGAVTLTSVNDEVNQELQTVLNTHPTPGMLNAYFIPHYFDIHNRNPARRLDQTLGIAFSADMASRHGPSGHFPGTQAGITVKVNGTSDPIERNHTVAHEIGHALALEHYGNGNPPNRREDIWAHRCLMHNIVGLVDIDDATEHPLNRFHRSLPRTMVGYGDLGDGTACTGQLLGTKQVPGILQSNQIDIIRQAAGRQTFAPVRI